MASKDKIDKREKIIKAALEMMCESGASFIKLNEIAKKAKVPAPLIHYYFKDIEDLHYEVIMIASANIIEYSIRELEPNPSDHIKMMKAYIRGPMIWAKENPKLMSIWMYFYYLSSYRERFKELNSQMRITGRDRISLMILRGIEKKQFKISPEIKISEIAEEIQSLITGHTIMFATENTGYKMEHYFELCTKRVLIILGVNS